ncbi:MAG: threonine-phosphate decarboxylase [Paracoccaceae bacterium]
MTTAPPGTRPHGGNLDEARAAYGGDRAAWLDLSTGINPRPYPLPDFPAHCWRDLPDTGLQDRLVDAARRFWSVPGNVDIVAANGASALIAALPRVFETGSVHIPAPTYNEHAAAFSAAGWRVSESRDAPDEANARVLVNPNNPDGTVHGDDAFRDVDLGIADESFADTLAPGSLPQPAARKATIRLKSFGKFWGLAGTRLGFAVCPPAVANSLRSFLGPWNVSGPALVAGACALDDTAWAARTRKRLASDAKRLDVLVGRAGAEVEGGTSLFRLYRVDSAERWHRHLATHRIWSRVFPFHAGWIRLGLPGTEDAWGRLEKALEAVA